MSTCPNQSPKTSNSARPLFRVLIADDDRSIRQLLVRTLDKAGYASLQAGDGEQAVALAQKARPDAILMDINMPVQDGLSACRRLKADPTTAGIPVVFVTNSSDGNSVLEAFRAGGCDFIAKPFTPREVLARVGVHLRLWQGEQMLRAKNAELESLAAELARQSRVDPLTNLLNRRSWDELISQEHLRYLRGGRVYSVIMIDLDCFKHYNDGFGHLAGDECLRRTARAIEDACREIDCVGRYGGEEFVVLAPETSAQGGVVLAERIRRSIWAMQMEHPGNGVHRRVSASLGVATPLEEGGWETAVRRADEALYTAKHAGRNLVISADEACVVLRKESLPTSTASRMAVLVAGAEASRALCRKALDDSEYMVIEAEGGEAALNAARSLPPDVVVLDAQLGDIDVLNCTRQLRARPEARDIPVIILTEAAEADEIIAGLEAGADEYLSKPIRPHELQLRVRSMARLRLEHKNLLRSYEARGEHMRLLARLIEFCRDVCGCDEREAILEHTVQAVADISLARQVCVLLPDGEQETLRVAAARGMSPELSDSIELPVHDSLPGEVLRRGRAVLINDEGGEGALPRAGDSGQLLSSPMLATPLSAPGGTVGVLNVTQRLRNEPFSPQEIEYIEMIAGVAGTAIHFVAMRAARDEASDSIMVALAKLAEYRDTDTGLHLDRVEQFCLMLARHLRGLPKCVGQITDSFLFDLERAVPLHDIGKVAIPDDILLQPGKLSPEQMEIMRTHTLIGARAIQDLIRSAPGVGFLRIAAQIACWHHERWDGNGYPHGLRGDEIPLAARIVSVADVYDALTTKRVYKDAFSHDKAVAIIVEGRGTQFDPDVVDAFVELEKQFEALSRELADSPSEVTRTTSAAPLQSEPA